jgi:hypothetical protein
VRFLIFSFTLDLNFPKFKCKHQIWLYLYLESSLIFLHIWFVPTIEWILQITCLYLLIFCNHQIIGMKFILQKRTQVCWFLVEQSLFILQDVPFIYSIWYFPPYFYTVFKM